MAKVRRLFETDDDKMPSANPKKEHQLDGVVRDILDRRREPQEGVDVSLPTPTSKQLLQELDVSNEVKAVLSRFFIIDHTSRATSAQLLQSEEFKTLEAAAR